MFRRGRSSRSPEGDTQLDPPHLRNEAADTVTEIPLGRELTPSLRVERTSVTDKVAARLRQALFNGELAPGTPLREIELSQRLGVSRGTLREALRILESESLLSREPNRGVIVKQLTHTDLADLYHARLVIEPGAVGARPFGPLPPGSVAQLRATFQRYRKALANNDEQAITDTHIGFHVELVALGGNARLTKTAAALLAEMRVALAAADRRHHDTSQQLATHHDLLTAIIDPDPTRGATALTTHLLDAYKQMANSR